jgi:hypothetical protein
MSASRPDSRKSPARVVRLVKKYQVFHVCGGQESGWNLACVDHPGLPGVGANFALEHSRSAWAQVVSGKRYL